MDGFEKHIIKNKEQFDTHKADKEKLWENIASRLEQPKPKVIPLWKSPFAKIAATVLFLLGVAGVLGYLNYNSSVYNEDTIVSKELLDIDMHYKGLVAYQVKLLQNHKALSDSDKEEFLAFIKELDDEYDLLREEMKENLDNERVLEAIIGNYKRRIEIIENLLQQINDSKKTDENYGYTL